MFWSELRLDGVRIRSKLSVGVIIMAFLRAMIRIRTSARARVTARVRGVSLTTRNQVPGLDLDLHDKEYGLGCGSG